MTLEQAVGILNKHRWRERDDWFIWLPATNQEAVSRSMHDSGESFDAIYREDAIAIASFLELREACKPILAMLRDDVTLADGDWHRFAALLEEQP